jgi:hypothetical protein
MQETTSLFLTRFTKELLRYLAARPARPVAVPEPALTSSRPEARPNPPEPSRLATLAFEGRPVVVWIKASLVCG